MFALSKKRSALRIFLLVAVVVTTFFTAHLILHKNNKNVDAVSSAGESAWVGVAVADPSTSQGAIYFNPAYGDAGKTYKFNVVVTHSNGSQDTYEAYCAEADKGNPEGSFGVNAASNTSTYNMMKLMIYIKQYRGSNSYVTAASNAIFPDSWDTSDNMRYAFTHFVLSKIFTGNHSVSKTGLTQTDKDNIDAAVTYLQNAISTNSVVWRQAQGTSLFWTHNPNDSTAQVVVWLEGTPSEAEPDDGQIVVTKKDAGNNSSTPQGSATFNGTTFQLINNSGGSIVYNNTTIANGGVVATKTLSSGATTATFSNLPYAAYQVRETASGTGYSVNSTAQSVTVNSSTAQSVTFSNTVITGQITVTKKDSATTGCAPQGDASFNGTQFRIINKSTNAIVYGGSSKAVNAVIDTKSLSNGSCSVTFTGLPYGTYEIQEVAHGTGYTLDASSQTATINSSATSVTKTFSNTAVTGEITVNKKDKDTGTCTTVGDASFNGTQFRIINKSTNAIIYGGSSKAVNAVIDTKTLENGACSVTFENLPYGRYEVQEVTHGIGYELNSTPQTATIPSSNTLNFTNEATLGNVTVNKIDEYTGTCTTISETSFNGTTFSITNNSAEAVYYGGVKKDVGAVIDTKSLTNGACSVTFEDLPYGTYTVRETAISEGYDRNTKVFTVHIPHEGTTDLEESVTIANKETRGDVQFIKMDGTNSVPMSNIIFKITALDRNIRQKEYHLVVTDENGVVNTASSANLHSNHTNGYDEIWEDALNKVTYAGYGTWFGIDVNGDAIPVNDDARALPYGRYLIEEVRCDYSYNFFCTNIMNQVETIEINQPEQVYIINEDDGGIWENTCQKFSLETEAVDNADGDKIIEASKEIKIKDNIHYCAKHDVDFIIKGILMDKATGEPLLVNGETVEQSINLKPEEDCGDVEMVFTLDASKLAGKEVVVFESLYYVHQDDEMFITSHEDLDDANQTVEIISLRTVAKNPITGGKILAIDEEVEIEDTVYYCLVPNLEYTIKGILMDKKTGKELLVDDETIEQEYTFTPEEACGQFEMTYTLDTTDLAGTKIVIFESLYRDNELLLEHKDINNEDETVEVEVPIEVPDTGVYTNIFGQGGAGTTLILLITTSALGLSGYAVRRHYSKKKFLNWK